MGTILRRMQKGTRFSRRQPGTVPQRAEPDWEVYRYGMKHFDHVMVQRNLYNTPYYEVARDAVHRQLLYAARTFNPDISTLQNYAIQSVSLALAHPITTRVLNGFSGIMLTNRPLQRVENQADPTLTKGTYVWDLDRPAADGDQPFELTELTAAIKAHLDEYDPRLFVFLSAYACDGLTLKQLGDMNGLTKEGVRQVILKAIRLAHEYLTTKGVTHE